MPSEIYHSSILPFLFLNLFGLRADNNNQKSSMTQLYWELEAMISLTGDTA